MLVVLYPIRKFSYQLVIVNRSYLAAVCHGKELHGIGRVQGFGSHPIVFVCVCVCVCVCVRKQELRCWDFHVFFYNIVRT